MPKSKIAKDYNRKREEKLKYQQIEKNRMMQFNPSYTSEITKKIGQRKSKRRSLEHKRNHILEEKKIIEKKQAFKPIPQKMEEEKEIFIT